MHKNTIIVGNRSAQFRHTTVAQQSFHVTSNLKQRYFSMKP
jgi:hypothetical protein